MSSGDPTIIEASDVRCQSFDGKITTTTTPVSTKTNRLKPNKTLPSHISRKTPSSSRRNDGSSKKVFSSSNRSPRECACGRGVACFGMTQAFRLLGDPRSYHVELPRYRKDPPAFKYVFRNNLRQAYLRQLVRKNPTNKQIQEELLLSSSDTKELSKTTTTTTTTTVSDNYIPKRCYVALHHFHPTIVRAFYENPLTSAQKHKVPISITEHELYELGMDCLEEDRILSASGNPTGGYYFTPGYPHEKAHEDLKLLIQSVRTSRIKMNRSSTGTGTGTGTSSSKKRGDPNVPTNIEIITPKNDGDGQLTKSTHNFKEKQIKHIKREDRQKEKSGSDQYDGDNNENDVMNEFKVSGDENTISSTGEEFENIWDKPAEKEIKSGVFSEQIIEEEEEQTTKEESKDEIGDGDRLVDTVVDAGSAQHTNREYISSRRSVDRPWETPKYRRDRDKGKRRSSGAAHYIDPNIIGELNNKLASTPEIIDDGEDIARIAADMEVFQLHREEKYDIVSPIPIIPDSPKRFSSNKTPYSPKRSSDDDVISLSSAESGTSSVSNYVKLGHQLPGTDPTLRIQVHNDLIAWESKRRSDLAQKLEYNRERWKAACDVMNEGITEALYAERLIMGILKASRLFADSLRAVYDDKLLDDKGNTVKNSFIQNRLAKQRSAFEYSIESTAEDLKQGPGQSVLLDSIVNAQLEVAKAFMENSEHMEQEILPEIIELKEEIQKSSRELKSIGDAVILELKRSEIEVKNIWDVFDAMVTGDLMEYSVHGSTHGGSSHGGSFHSSSMTGGSGSVHGFLTHVDDNEAPIVSSAQSPLVKSTFHQLGSVEDGWLIEMYYKSAVAYQRSVFGAAEMELCNLFQEITTLEETRFRKLHQLMLAFAPRQRRLFNKLPEQLKNVLENLVGLRIDEESLQKVLDESVRDRSRDHLKGSTAHKSSIMNRSRVNVPVDSAENEIEEIEKTYGSPFASPMILLSKVVELKATGLASLVNTAWKPSLAVVTSEGNMLVFETPGNPNTPIEAFKSLYPIMNFDDQNTWVTGRKYDIVKSLTPIVSLRLTKSTLAIPQMRKNQLEITEETGAAAGSRFMNAVKSGVRQTKSTLSGAQQTNCTLRLPSPSDATDWINLLERTKKVLHSQTTSGRSSRFKF